ncbi:hypothetical protein NE236_28905 [Actinoallomurus purpureus]|uniref:hypothetical protein n=1 Tax=Actinoallomurus purpureus TaxID=478114 RepID=UPI002092CBFA|nr:hypothetical protein [Actinoallomurus purpureus]MCO6009000.1 hypothetical protein [Actinoallomurus purpureus]
MNEPPAWLRSALREEADAHQPDHDRMRARVDAATRPRRIRRAGGRSLAAAAMAAAGVVAVAVAVVVVTWRSAGPATPAIPAGHGSAQTDGPSPSASRTASPATRVGRPSPTARPTTSSPVARRPRTKVPAVVARIDPGSNDYWAQEDVTVSGERPLSTLQVTVRVARTQGVRSAGSWSSLPGDAFAVTVGDERGALVYRWALRPGRSVPPGSYVFAAQYTRAPGGRDAHRDTYTVTASEGTGRPLTAHGHF